MNIIPRDLSISQFLPSTGIYLMLQLHKKGYSLKITSQFIIGISNFTIMLNYLKTKLNNLLKADPEYLNKNITGHKKSTISIKYLNKSTTHLTK